MRVREDGSGCRHAGGGGEETGRTGGAVFNLLGVARRREVWEHTPNKDRSSVKPHKTKQKPHTVFVQCTVNVNWWLILRKPLEIEAEMCYHFVEPEQGGELPHEKQKARVGARTSAAGERDESVVFVFKAIIADSDEEVKMKWEKSLSCPRNF